MFILLTTTLATVIITVMILIFLRSRTKQVAGLAVSRNRPLTPNSLTGDLPATDIFDISHRTFINGWQLPGQANDRAPISGTIADCAGSTSARRSSTRRAQQMMYKEWSRTRNDQ